MTNCKDDIIKFASLPFVETRLCATRKEYLSWLKKCDLNTTNSQHETFCIAAVESMAFGQPLVAPRAITFPEITGTRKNGYPYLFDTGKEQRAFLVKLLRSREERMKWGKELRRHVMLNYGQGLWAERYVALFESLYHRVGPWKPRSRPEEMMAKLTAILKRNKGKTPNQIWRAINDTRFGGKQSLSNQSLPLPKFLRIARQLGATIDVRGNDQRVYLR